MLSKMHLFILGLIKEKPINPYGVQKFFEQLKVKQWLPYADSSIYASFRALEKKNLIQGETEKSGNNPEKSVYTITPSGIKLFLETLKSFLLKDSPDTQLLTFVMLFLCHLSKEEANALLVKRELAQIKTKNNLSAQIKALKENPKSSGVTRINVEYQLLINLATLEALKRLRAEIQTTASWNRFLSNQKTADWSEQL